MEERKVNSANGMLWFKQGYWLFKKSPLLWVVLVMIGTLGLIGTASIPVIGDPLATLLFPVILGGYMLGSRALELGEELELAHLFAGFRQHAQQLVTLGGINLVSQLLILGLMKLTGGAALVEIMMTGMPADNPAAAALLAQAIRDAGIALPLGGILFCVLLLAMQLAPMLVIFGKMEPVAALKTSFQACLRNMGALSVYGVVILVFGLAATMAMMLGWIVLLPVMIASMYAIYRDLFPTQIEDIASGKDEAATASDQT